MMRGYASADARSPLFQHDVLNAAVSDDPISDTWNYLNRYTGSRGMQFVSDERTGAAWSERWRPLVEAMIRPVDQAWLSNPQGDCDDYAMYGAAHLIARGVLCSFATVGADDQDPSVYSHVYLVAYPGGKARGDGSFARAISRLGMSEPIWEAARMAGIRAEPLRPRFAPGGRLSLI